MIISHSEELTKSLLNSVTKIEVEEDHHASELADWKAKFRNLRQEL